MLQNSNQQFIPTGYISSRLSDSPPTSDPSTLKKLLFQDTNDVLAVKYFLPKVCTIGHSLVSPFFIVPSQVPFSLPTPFNNSFCQSHCLLTLNGLQAYAAMISTFISIPETLLARIFCYVPCFLLPVRYTNTLSQTRM